MKELMVPEDVTREIIVSLDDDVIAITTEIAESGIIEELCLSQQTEVQEKERKDGDKKLKRGIVRSKPISILKIKSRIFP